MGRIHRLPFIFGCSAAIVAGIISYATGVNSQGIYIRMAIMMIVFYLIGSYVKDTALRIEKEVEDKKREEQRLEEQQLRQQTGESKNAAAARQDAQREQQAVRKDQPQAAQQGTLNLTADEDFEPMTLSKAVSSKIKE